VTGFDPVRVIEVLADHGVEFVIIGGFAAELHGAPGNPAPSSQHPSLLDRPPARGCRLGT